MMEVDELMERPATLQQPLFAVGERLKQDLGKKATLQSEIDTLVNGAAYDKAQRVIRSYNGVGGARAEIERLRLFRDGEQSVHTAQDVWRK